MPNKNNEEFVASLKRREEEDLIRYLAQKRGLPYLDLTHASIESDALQLIAEEEARHANIAVIERIGKKLRVALSNPDTPEAQAILEKLKQRFTLELFLVSPQGLAFVWERYREGTPSAPVEQGVIDISETKLVDWAHELTRLSASTDPRQVSHIFELLLAWAVREEASDLHLEPEATNAKIRLRLDGILYDVAALPMPLYGLILSRIKLISELKLNIHERAQEGRFTIRALANNIEVRTSVIPGTGGESVVMRILHPRTITLQLDDLGMHPHISVLMAEEIKKPNGMILTTGPTGSGKTTTLYAFLKHVRSSKIKIITIEDPVEYHLDGITQTQVDTSKDYHFANGLASILRQDPDVIMVGEIRDLDTAQTALHAALTGHLVFSTLHTNNAPATIPRLIDLGVKPNIIAPAINLTMAQRLVRRLCETCKIKKEASAEERAFLEEEIKNMPKAYKPQKKSFVIYEANETSNCPACGGRGWKGRVGIFEVFRINDAIETLILGMPSEARIRQEALAQGMLTMQQDGILKVLQGITSLEELKRVAG
ncbi:MAG: GspE/PulE family protein [Patescibacteria group bacterium]